MHMYIFVNQLQRGSKIFKNLVNYDVINIVKYDYGRKIRYFDNVLALIKAANPIYACASYGEPYHQER